MPGKYSVGHQEVTSTDDGVTDGSGLRVTSTISYITPRVIFYFCALITSDFDPNFLLIEIGMWGVQTPPCGNLNRR